MKSGTPLIKVGNRHRGSEQGAIIEDNETSLALNGVVMGGCNLCVKCRAGKWLQKPMFFRLIKNPKNLKSPKFRFLSSKKKFCAILYRSYLISYSDRDS